MQRSPELNVEAIRFTELESHFGFDSARDILRSLERSEGISEEFVSAWSYEDRLTNVFRSMLACNIPQTRH